MRLPTVEVFNKAGEKAVINADPARVLEFAAKGYKQTDKSVATDCGVHVSAETAAAFHEAAEEAEKPLLPSLDGLTVKEMRAVAKEHEIPVGADVTTKEQLVALLAEAGRFD